MFCNNCGKQLPDGAQFCGGCGSKVTPAEETPVVAVEETPVCQPEETVQSFEAPEVQETKPAKKLPKKFIIIGAAALAAVAAILITFLLVLPMVNYNKGLDYLESGDYAKAQKCLESAGDYSDAKDTLKDLKTFRKALDKLEEHDFVKAEEYFSKVKRFLNSKEYIESIIPYEKALYFMQCADNEDEEGYEALYGYTPDEFGTYEKKELYNSAASLFEDLEDYGDAKQKKNECYYKAGVMYIAEENWYTVESYIDMMDEDQKQTLIDTYMESCADQKFLTALKQALKERSELVASGGTREQIVAAEKALLEELPNAHFYDDELQDLCYDYVYALTSYEEYSIRSSNPEYWWLQGGIQRHEVLDTLNEKYDFLNDDETLKKEYIGTKYRLEVAYELYDELNYILVYHDYDKDQCYIEITNPTDYKVKLTFKFEFIMSGEVAHTTTLPETEFAAGETKTIYFDVPEDIYYWNNDSSYTYELIETA